MKWMLCFCILAGVAAKAEASWTPARPIDPATWINDADYPPEAAKEGAGGKVGFQLDIDKEGRATKCSITQSSGSDMLDNATCRLLLVRARFTPAADTSGHPIEAQYYNNVRWAARRAAMPYALAAGNNVVQFDVAADGSIKNCTVQGTAEPTQTEFCSLYDRVGVPTGQMPAEPRHVVVRTNVTITDGPQGAK